MGFPSDRKMILKCEKKLMEWGEKRIDYIFLCCITLIAILVRFKLTQFIISDDAEGFLLNWYSEIKSAGGFSALSNQVGDYGILYQTIIALFTYLPIEPLYAFKLFSCIFDFILALSSVAIIREITHSKKYDVYAYTIMILSPVILLNSSAWAQCDSIYTAFCCLTILFALKEKYFKMMVLYGIAMTFKLQAIFLLPLFFYIWFVKKKFSCLYFLLIPAIMILLSVGGIIHGRGLFDVFEIYVSQEGHYQQMIKGYYGLWTFFSSGTNVYRTPGILLSLGLCGVMIFSWVREKVPAIGKNIIWMAFLSVYLVVLTMPSMHERYGFLYEVLALIIVILDRRTILGCVGIQLLTFIMYGESLVNESVSEHLLAFFNIFIFVFYLYLFYTNDKQDLNWGKIANREGNER